MTEKKYKIWSYCYTIFWRLKSAESLVAGSFQRGECGAAAPPETAEFRRPKRPVASGPSRAEPPPSRAVRWPTHVVPTLTLCV